MPTRACFFLFTYFLCLPGGQSMWASVCSKPGSLTSPWTGRGLWADSGWSLPRIAVQGCAGFGHLCRMSPLGPCAACCTEWRGGSGQTGVASPPCAHRLAFGRARGVRRAQGFPMDMLTATSPPPAPCMLLGTEVVKGCPPAWQAAGSREGSWNTLQARNRALRSFPRTPLGL